MSHWVTEFNLDVVSGDIEQPHSASITGAFGSFEGGTSHFGVSGDGALDGDDGAFNASGSFYGPAAQSMGGIWRIETEGSNATGIFHGDKQGEIIQQVE
ncbi:MAG: hypothetical protein Q8N95_07070 [Desulfobacterales bacterium]|nr:hypothetical protein [Desulfobacterales bacterium]